MADRDQRIGLALSGGGFRATLFHLGVVRFLFEAGLLSRVKLVSAVSGGSILAAHLILNWEKYKASKKDFDAAALEILLFVQADIRGLVLRRWIFGCLTVVPRFILPRARQWSLINLLQREYAGLFRVSLAASAGSPVSNTENEAYRDATIRDLRGDRPAVRFNCTSLTSGEPCYFDQAGFGWCRDGVIERPIPALSLRVAYAVAASSAFPPLFPPIEISNVTLGCDHVLFNREQRLTDGGVFDNLGLGAVLAAYDEVKSAPDQKISLDSIIVSDAEGNFDSDFNARFSFPVSRNVRASDLLMKRVSILQLQDFEADSAKTDNSTRLPFVRVKIKEAIRDLDDQTVLEPEVQRALINVRTDLDRFTPEEVTALIAHGYSKCREALIDKGMQMQASPTFTWDPLGNWQAVKRQIASEFDSSRVRQWRLWTIADPISLATGAYLVCAALILAAPTALLVRQNAIEAERAAQASQRAALARQEAAIAAQATRAAQAGVLDSTIDQIQSLMVSMSQGCSGGSNGVPPVNWGNLQRRGNNAVNALIAAKSEVLAERRSNALGQISIAQREADALVGGARGNCSGGSSGIDPVAFGSYLRIQANLLQRLGTLQSALAP